MLVIAGGVALGYALTRKAEGGMSQQGTQAMGAAIGELDGDVKAARTATRERAATLASVPAVQAAITTDEATVADMVERGELDFKAEPGEVITLDQVAPGKPPLTLAVYPPGAMHKSPASKPGSFVEMMGDRVLVTEVAPITPKDPKAHVGGFVAVSRPLDLQPAIARLVAAGVSGRFELDGKIHAIGSPPPDAVEQPPMPLPSQPEVKIVVAAPRAGGGTPLPLIAVGGGGALLGLVVVIVAMMRRPAAPAATAARASGALANAGDIATADTRFSAAHAVAAATPVPVAISGPAIAGKPVEAGAMIGRWEVVSRLGSGGMADVYLARARGEAGFEKLVAIKVMHPHLARNPRAVDHFLDEARLAARITHPNVVAIQDLGKIGDDYVIVMEYVDGVDLERLLASARNAQRAVPIAVGLGLLRRICDGLAAAHGALGPDGQPLNLVHRDVKSANVLVSRQGGVKVVDFGIAKAASQAHMTYAGETKGTPSMMAPEQRVGEQVDVRADVYSVAAVGYEILTGHAVNLDLAALAHLGVENWPHLPMPSALRGQLPRELDELLLGAMAFDRARRPASCVAFETSIEAIMKRHDLNASDKDIARWVTSELEQLQPDPATTPMSA